MVELCFIPMSVKENMVFKPTQFYIRKAQKMLEFARIGLKLSSCLKLDNWIVDVSLDSGPEWYFKFDILNFWYKMDELLFEIIYFVLNTSIKWVRSLSIYLIALCMVELCFIPMSVKKNMDFWIYTVLYSKSSKDVGICPNWIEIIKLC